MSCTATCRKKCFFEIYRFSEDLDFTLRDEGQIAEGFLKRVPGEVIVWVADEYGLVLPQDPLRFDIYRNPHGRVSCQGKVGLSRTRVNSLKRGRVANADRPRLRTETRSFQGAARRP